MAEGKKSFVAYCDWLETFEALPDDKAGQLAKHLFRYVNDLNPESNDVLINAVFANIKHTLKRDLIRYEDIKIKRQESGKLGGRPKKQDEAKKANGFLKKQNKAKKPVSVNDNVSDSVNVNEIIDIIYSLYPSKCPTRNSSTGKCSKDKDKIESILKTKSSHELTGIIEKYVNDCTKNKVYMKNFSTFLNNLPDYSESSSIDPIEFNYDDYEIPSNVWFGLSPEEIKEACLNGTYPLISSLYKK